MGVWSAGTHHQMICFDRTSPSMHCEMVTRGGSNVGAMGAHAPYYLPELHASYTFILNLHAPRSRLTTSIAANYSYV
jgi:hypothetical protein